jgi:hypothetical protein
MFLEGLDQYLALCSDCTTVEPKFRTGSEPLWRWTLQAQIDSGQSQVFACDEIADTKNSNAEYVTYKNSTRS